MTTTLSKDWTTWTLESVRKALYGDDGKGWNEDVMDSIYSVLPEITQREILNLFLEKDHDHLGWAVRNPLVTAEELEKFATMRGSVRSGVAENPNLTEHICEILIENEDCCGAWDDFIYPAMCSHFGGALPEKLLFKCILELGEDWVDEDDYNTEVYTTSTDIESLTAIMNTGASICDYIGLNPIWTEEQREDWVKSEHKYVRAGMASLQTPRRLLELLANDPDEYVRMCARETLEELDDE